MSAALTHLIPLRELAPGAVSAFRNQVIANLLAVASVGLKLPPERLVIRDIRPRTDLQMYGVATTDATTELWGYGATGTTVGFATVTGDKTMGDQRFVALYGVRDRGLYYGAQGSATLAVALTAYKSVISLIRINVGGTDRVTWDSSCLRAYEKEQSAFSPAAVIIPQNASYNISYYRTGSIEAGAMTAPVDQEITWLELVGFTCEPRGKTISP